MIEHKSPWFLVTVETHGTRYRVTLSLDNNPLKVEREVQRRDGTWQFIRHWGGMGGTWEYGPPPQGTISRKAIDLAIAEREAADQGHAP
jgi:hypothetical protein